MTSVNPFVFPALIQLIFPHFLLSSHFFLCGCPNRAPISSTAVTLLNTHTNNSFGEARFNPLLLCSIYGLSISLLTRGQHEFGSVCCFCCFPFSFLFLAQHQNIRPVQQMVPVYILHLCKSNQNHASSRWLHSHMQRKSHFGLIFSRKFKAKVKRLPTRLLEVYTVRKIKKDFVEKQKSGMRNVIQSLRTGSVFAGADCLRLLFASERNKVIRSQSHRVTKSDFLIQCAYRVRHEFVDVALSHQHLAYCLLPRLAA